MAKNVGVILAGCGVYDGSEIHEAVLTLLALDRAGAKVIPMAPDISQMHVVNHQTGEIAEGEARNVMIESARIARGEVRDIAGVKATELDALVIPGGFGAAKNLSNFAVKGAECEVEGGVNRLIYDMYSDNKPIVAICIAPATLTKALTSEGALPQVTIGNDPKTAAAINTMGGRHVKKAVDEYHFDAVNNVYSTPAYMLGPSIKDVALGIENTINAMMETLG